MRSFRFPRRLIRLAKRLTHSPEELNDLASNVEGKANRVRGKIATVYEDLLTMTRLLKEWAKGNYRIIPWKSLVRLIVALLYFLLIVDAIPDFLIGIGYFDDLAVILWTIKAIHEDLDAFRKWETNHGREIQ